MPQSRMIRVSCMKRFWNQNQINLRINPPPIQIKSALNAVNMGICKENARKTRKKREELSVLASKSIKKEQVKIVVEFK